MINLKSFSVWSAILFDVINFLPNPHDRYSIASSPMKGRYKCLLCVQSQIYVVLLWLHCCIWFHVLCHAVSAPHCYSKKLPDKRLNCLYYFFQVSARTCSWCIVCQSGGVSFSWISNHWPIVLWDPFHMSPRLLHASFSTSQEFCTLCTFCCGLVLCILYTFFRFTSLALG